MKGESGDKARLEHILDSIQEIKNYTRSSSFKEFELDSMMKFACIKQIEIIGEAANHLSETTQTKYNSIDWRAIVALRNILIHEYFGVDDRIVWNIIQSDLPNFEKQIREMLDSFVE